MTPEQISLVEEMLESSLGAWEDDGSGDDDQALKRSTLDAFDALVAEHAAMKAQLHWRATSEIATDGCGGMVLVRGRGNDVQYWYDTCHIDELHEGDEWMPVPP